MARGKFWNLANYVRDMVTIELLKNFTNLRHWVNQEISLETIKLRLDETANIDKEIKQQINNYDANFDDMCTRIGRIHLSLQVQTQPQPMVRQQDRSALQIHAMQWDQNQNYHQGYQNQKNGYGLAQARRNNKFNRLGEGWNQGGKGGRTQNKSWNNNKTKGWKSNNPRGSRAQRMELPCTWDTCQGKPAHTRKACPEWLKLQCTLQYCPHQHQPHTRALCSSPPIEEATQPAISQSHNHNRGQGKGGNRQNQQLAQQLEFNYLLQQVQSQAQNQAGAQR